MNLWPNQLRAMQEVPAAYGRGVRRLALTSPTGTGKSRIVCELIQWAIERNWYAILYTNRKMLLEQLASTLDEAGILYGIRAADHDEELAQPVQISSLPTERQRVLTSRKWDIHGHGRMSLVVVDEAHSQGGDTARQILGRHYDAGHYIVGVTATPLGLNDQYDELLVCGNVTEGRECGALVYAKKGEQVYFAL